MRDKVKIGIIGCGNISGAYLEAVKTFKILEIKSCADLDMKRDRAVSFTVLWGITCRILMSLRLRRL